MRWTSAILVVGLSIASASAEAFIWPNAIEQIQKDLRSDDVGTRRGAARRLVELPHEVAKKLVLQAMNDPDEEVRLAAAEAAVQLRLESASEQAIPWLNDPERGLRLAAAELLRQSPHPRATAPLARLLSDQEPSVRAAAAVALGESGDPAAATALLGHLDDSIPSVREVVVDALAQLRDPSAVVPLIGKIQDSRIGVRRRVAAALGELGDSRAESALTLALQDADEEVVVEALGALGKLKSSGAASTIVLLLDERTEVAIQLAAVRALARIGSPLAVEALIEMLGRTNDAVSSDVVVEALVVVGPSAVPRLRQCLSGQPASSLAEGCALTLGKSGAKEAVQSLTSALRRGVVRPAVALDALAELGRPGSVPTVLEFLADRDSGVRQAAIEAAAELLDPRQPDGRAVEPIARALSAPGIPVAERTQLAHLLGRTGSPRAVRRLIPLAENSDDLDLRVAAIRALGSIPPAGQDQVLIEALDAEAASVRWAAAVALRASASGASTRVLLERIEERPEQDRVALAVAVAGALSRNEDTALVERVAALVKRSRGAERDALLEALGHAPQEKAAQLLADLAKDSSSVADRAKVAEALARHTKAVSSLAVLAKDVDGSVRANAVWSLGIVGGKSEVPQLESALRDRDVAVAGNAAAALGRVAQRTKVQVKKPLCAALGDTRAYVRANALAGLAIANQRCAKGLDRALLQSDPSAEVRRAAALLLHRVSAPSNQADDARALAYCTDSDRDGSVAAVCALVPEPLTNETDPITVYVVPAGEASPAPAAPFALVLPDGVMRLGVTDRRGVVHEFAAPRGTVSLAVPAPLVRQ